MFICKNENENNEAVYQEISLEDSSETYYSEIVLPSETKSVSSFMSDVYDFLTKQEKRREMWASGKNITTIIKKFFVYYNE
jgi:hypothetical protein